MLFLDALWGVSYEMHGLHHQIVNKFQGQQPVQEEQLQQQQLEQACTSSPPAEQDHARPTANQVEELTRQVALLAEGSARLERERDSLLEEKVSLTTTCVHGRDCLLNVCYLFRKQSLQNI